MYRPFGWRIPKGLYVWLKNMLPQNLYTLADTVAAIRSGEISVSALVELALTQIKAAAHLNSLAHLDEAGARQQAALLDAEAKRGQMRGPLHGLPITVKDLFAVRGMPMQAGTRATLPPLGQDEATAVTRLRQAGAIILAKANMHEIALGITGQNIFTGDVCNPIDPARQAGGSSSGSAASIGAGIGWLSLGSDTAGSIRIPSANCGTVGFKPTHGVVPLQGALALCATCDHAGPIVRSVADAAIAYEILAQRPAPLDTSFTLSGLRLGHLRAYLEGCLGKRERVAFERLLMWLRDHGAQIVDVNPTDIELGPPAYTPLARAEAADVHRVALKVEPQNFSDIVRPALQNGATVTAVDYFAACRQREQVITGINDCLRSVDALIMPTTPVIAPLRGSIEVELESGTAQHRPAFLHLSIPYSFTGIPAISLPYAMVQGMPVSVQLASTPHAEIRVLNIGHALETALAHEPL